MDTLYDIFKYNNIPYSELTNQKHKNIIDKIVGKLKETGYEQQLLEFRDRNNHPATYWIQDNLDNGYALTYDTNLELDMVLKNAVDKANVSAMSIS